MSDLTEVSLKYVDGLIDSNMHLTQENELLKNQLKEAKNTYVKAVLSGRICRVEWIEAALGTDFEIMAKEFSSKYV